MQALRRDPSTVPVTFIQSDEKLVVLEDALKKAVRVAVDTETHKALVIDGIWAALRVVSYAVKLPGEKPGEFVYQAFVVDFRDVSSTALGRVHKLIEEADAWNANFDDRVTRIAKVKVKKWRDAMLTDALLHAGVPGFDFYHGLAWAAKRYIKAEMSGKGTTQVSYDGESDLTDEQVRYAGHDAVITIWVAEELDKFVEVAKIRTAVELDQGGRPFVAAMMEYGIPFDVIGWKQYLGSHETKMKAALKLVTEKTGGGAVDDTLFGTFVSEEPTWNIESTPDKKAALNKWIPELVTAFIGPGGFTATHQLDKTALKQMIQIAEASKDEKLLEQSTLCQALLDYGKHAKVLQTYGDSILKFVGEDGRMHPRYNQALTATGRLSSDKPNAQNFSPDMKPFIRPPHVEGQEERVFVHADLSQAELRVLAQLAAEGKMIRMFEQGGDFHALTAGEMFSVDMEALFLSDIHEYSNFRKKAKGVNFGIPYGLGAAALAVSLTVNSGLKTETNEAAAMLKTYGETYTRVDAWLKERDAFVKGLASEPPAIDWASTFKLHELYVAGAQTRKAFKRQHGYVPSGARLAEELQPDHILRAALEEVLGHAPSDEEFEQERKLQGDALEWAFTFDAPVVLTHDGSPFQFESRTFTGRRRLFMVSTDSTQKDKFAGVITSAMLLLATSDKEGAAAYRDEFAAKHGLDLPKGVNRIRQKAGEDNKSFRNRSQEARKQERMRCIKAFEGPNKPLKAELVKGFVERFGVQAGELLLQTALGDQIRAKGNQFRNAPIQAGVGDIVLQAFAAIWEKLEQFEAAFPIQSVHDSLVIEANISDAPAIMVMVKEELEKAMNAWCPDVPAKADADIRRSMHDDDVIPDEELEQILAVAA